MLESTHFAMFYFLCIARSTRISLNSTRLGNPPGVRHLTRDLSVHMPLSHHAPTWDNFHPLSCFRACLWECMYTIQCLSHEIPSDNQAHKQYTIVFSALQPTHVNL